MMHEEPMSDDLRARRAAVFRAMREEQRQQSREATARLERTLAGDIPPRTRSHREMVVSTIVGSLGSVMVLRFTPLLATHVSVPNALLFAFTGGILGAVFGLGLDAENWEARVEHTALFAFLFGAGFGLLSLF